MRVGGVEFGDMEYHTGFIGTCDGSTLFFLLHSLGHATGQRFFLIITLSRTIDEWYGPMNGGRRTGLSKYFNPKIQPVSSLDHNRPLNW